MRFVISQDDIEREVVGAFEIQAERKDLQALYDQIGHVLNQAAPKFQHGWIKVYADPTRPVEAEPVRPVKTWAEPAAP